MKIKVGELNGAALDWAVAKAEGVSVDIRGQVHPIGSPFRGSKYLAIGDMGLTFRPSSDWRQGGPLIEKYQVWLSPPTDCEPRGWDADVYNADGLEGSGVRVITACDTALIAACRAIVASRVGPEVEIPQELTL